MVHAVLQFVPVILMIFTGWISRRRSWISPVQEDGISRLVFSILFPVLIFNILFTSSFKAENFAMMAYILAAFLMALGIGWLFRKAAGQFAPLAPFLCVTDEGGSVGLPLYLSLVSARYAVNTVTFDAAGCLICFGLCPILAQKAAGKLPSGMAALKQIASNPFLRAVFLGLVCNFAGVGSLLQRLGWMDLYTACADMLTTPVSALILFHIGYTLRLHPSLLVQVSRLLLVRLLIMAGIVGGLALLFPGRMADPVFLTGVLIYFACPPAFAMPGMIAPLVKTREDAEFCSDFISLNLLLTLLVYLLVSILIPLT